jgi:hypothetical protein
MHRTLLSANDEATLPFPKARQRSFALLGVEAWNSTQKQGALRAAAQWAARPHGSDQTLKFFQVFLYTS